MSLARAARVTFSTLRSKSNSGVWTPIVTSPLSAYPRDQARTYGCARIQLMHEYVQKLTSTVLPRSASRDNGAEFSHAVAPAKEGNVPSEVIAGLLSFRP